MDKIFIQIASYRDPELVPTIRDCINKAKNPERLTFGICWQRDETESLDEIINDNIRVIEKHYSESKGACWARSLTQSLYDGEEFTMQIDSHSRFVQDWDEILINMWESLNDSKAILTCYPPNYGPTLPESQWYKTPQICNVYKFVYRYTLHQPMDMPDYENRTLPRRGVFIAAGFIFGLGTIIKDVPYDPEFYFTGEEIALTLRLFTNGYNIYHPHKLILHHYYSRPDHHKHWSDHNDWGQYDSTAHKRLDTLLGYETEIDLGIYGLGTERTIDDFKNYSGIDYKEKLLHEYTEKGGEPPYDYDEEGWSNVKGIYKNVLKWDYNLIDKTDDIKFWAFIVKDQHDVAIYRWDCIAEEHPEIINGIVTERLFEFEHNTKKQIPKTLMIWPYSNSKEWIKNTIFRL